MPVLSWIGKEKILNHHKDVPFHTLYRKYSFDKQGSHEADNGSNNMVIHGDNLLALKSLLPKYEGKVDVIYIDPPYNTGNDEGTGWVYSDNVNDPQFTKWIGEVVGKEGEDMTRHDKWLCMMYPRLKLLHSLLSEDGIIFISIDDIEHSYLKLLCDEIFGRTNFIDNIIWKKRYGGGAKEKYLVSLQEYILMYAKNLNNIDEITIPLTQESIDKYYTKMDENFAIRGPYRTHPLEANKTLDARKNLVFPITAPDGTLVYPKRQWLWARDTVEDAISKNELEFTKDKKGNWSVQTKQYLRDSNGKIRSGKFFSIIDGIYTQHGTNELLSLFGDAKIFPYPKPSELIVQLLSLCPKKDALILDSFAGSGTTGQAVMKMNSVDSGHRSFILIEMMDYIDTVTTQRLNKTIQGYAKEKPIDSSYSYYELGEPMMIDDFINPDIPSDQLRQFIWFSETKDSSLVSDNGYYLGVSNRIGYYFCYDPHKSVALDESVVDSFVGDVDGYVVYADVCYLSDQFLKDKNIIFKKIPRDVRRF